MVRVWEALRFHTFLYRTSGPIVNDKSSAENPVLIALRADTSGMY